MDDHAQTEIQHIKMQKVTQYSISTVYVFS